MLSINAEKREIKGKKVKKLRESGKIPGIVYGAGEKEILLEIPEREFEKVFREAGESSLVELKIEGSNKNVLIHDVSFDPIKDRPVHVDFLQVRMDKLIKATVELSFDGESPAVKLGGILVKVVRELEIEALPKDLPPSINVDISKLLNFGDKFSVSDLELPKGVKVHASADEALALVVAPKTEEELKAEETIEAKTIESIEVVGKKKEEKAEEGEAEGEKAEGKES
ncbi:50S ribosomal protein L25 [Candidatus Giovannonibacteria bacterium]|nr:50S ribosomal protein L25 [Candidatus Giovannonibacteria bacterium]